ncbi:MAG: hypothetical protein Q8L86_07300 [Vicinamibacterales bacterium]|nr:hypothetical protein [Vicinamibacterales bacterium]
MKTAAGVGVLLGGLVTGDWLGSVAVAVLFAAWWLVRIADGPPVLAAALTFHWIQVSIGLFYASITGRTLSAITSSDYRTMVLIGLGCVLALAAGLHLGMRATPSRSETAPPIHAPIFGLNTLIVIYIGLVATAGGVQQLAWQFPIFTQAILAVSYLRLGLVYVLMRRLSVPSPDVLRIAVLLTVEVGLGLTGFFASFREPLILAAIALSEVFDSKRASHWATASGVVAGIVLVGLFWSGVRAEYRQDFYDVEAFAETRSMRLERINVLASDWVRSDAQEMLWNVDFLVDRLWAIYYPALAVARVPSVLPHTEGSIIGGALRHIVTPRVFFPDKPVLPSDSEMVRTYSGVFVAGAEQDTSIAFGYAAEAYVDFGVPLMFLPVLLWGVFLGFAYQTVLRLIRHRELAIPVVTVIFWMSVFLFERSWIKWMGSTGTLLIYLGGMTYAIDWWLRQREAADAALPQATGPLTPPIGQR